MEVHRMITPTDSTVIKRDKERVNKAGSLDSLDIVFDADKHLVRRNGKGFLTDISLLFKRVNHNQRDRKYIGNGNQGKDQRKDPAMLCLSHIKYCCTSLLRVRQICVNAIAATSRKNTTAFA